MHPADSIQRWRIVSGSESSPAVRFTQLMSLPAITRWARSANRISGLKETSCDGEMGGVRQCALDDVLELISLFVRGRREGDCFVNA
jgi:hypothetical protein